ncbi:proteinase inhibitor I4 serpin [Pelomyxa schiedti]|nr:proteinase inhibitor I4 serpin [Pelomyxa schiedti]
MNTLKFGKSTMAEANVNLWKLKLSMLDTAAAGQSLSVDNAIWLPPHLEVKAEFDQINKAFYSAESQTLPTLGYRDISSWFLNKSHGLVTSPIAGLHPSDATIFTAAQTFTASWKSPFNPSETRKCDFTGIDPGTGMPRTERVSMMSLSHAFLFKKSQHYQAVRFECGMEGDSYIVTLLLPTRDECVLENFPRVMSGFRYHNGTVKVPEFNVVSRRLLNEQLGKLHMLEAFSNEANFTSLLESEMIRVHVAQVIHTASLHIFEGGIAAGSGVAIVMSRALDAVRFRRADASTKDFAGQNEEHTMGSCEVETPFYVSFNRPFVVVIQHTLTSAALLIASITTVI